MATPQQEEIMKLHPLLAVLMAATLGCAAGRTSDLTAADIELALQKNPHVLVDAIKANKKVIFEIVTQEAAEEQARTKQEGEAAEKKAFEDSFRNPLKPSIDANSRIRGRRDARLTLVEYADFQCPYCAAGYQTVEELRKNHPGDLRFVFKNLPLSFHPEAMPAAQWLEAVALQSPEKAWKFHDVLFQNQGKLSVDFYKKTARDLGLDVAKCEKDSESQAVKERIAADAEEAGKLGFNGTPGFLLNGIPVKGAYPAAHFDDIIKKLDTPSTN
jgi:protein-disulfide isomerase